LRCVGRRDELDRPIEHAESPYREIIAMAAALGTRLGEALGICWRHVDRKPQRTAADGRGVGPIIK
jgi:integrase